MSKLYDNVKKQGEQIDDLQKKVTSHGTRIETLELRLWRHLRHAAGKSEADNRETAG